jgi:SET domain-containing protein
MENKPMTSSVSFLSPKTEVRTSPIHGRGLFARRAIVKGEIVAIKGGRIFDREALLGLSSVLGPAEIQIADDLYIGPTTLEERERSMIFSNHSCDPNLGVEGQIVFVAMRDIDADEELTHDWAMTDSDDYRMLCNCGAACCRKTITGQDWKRKNLRAKYRGYFSWYLERRISGDD